MMKDSRGLIWLCSNFGLIRYDGKEFHNFRNSLTDTTSVSNDNVSHVLEDPDGSLWVSTNQGLNRFDFNTQSFTRFEHNPYNENSIASNEVIRTIIDSEGKVWIGTTTGLSLYLGDGKFKNWSDFHGMSRPYKYTAHGIAQDKRDKNLLWIVGAAGLFSFKKDSEQFTEHQPPIQSDHEDKNKTQRKSFTRLFIDADNTLWMGNNFGEIFHFNSASARWAIKSFRENGTPYCVINCITPYDNDHLWVCTGSKINSKRVHVLNKKTFEMSSFPTDSIHHNFETDGEGAIHIFNHQRFISWAIRPGGDYGRAIVFCKIGKRLIDLWFVFTALGNGTLQVVGNDSGSGSSKIMKCIFSDVNQIFRLLRVGGFNIGQLAAAQDGGKDFYFSFFTGVGINNGKFITGKVNVGLVTRFMPSTTRPWAPQPPRR